MGRTLSDDETRQQYIATMGQDLGSVFYGLYYELVLLHVRWREYTELFDTKPERVDLLNRAAGWFFKVVQDTLGDSALLAIARITDPERVGPRDTLTIQRLPKLISDPALAAEVQALVAVALAKAEFTRDQRNRRIAHNDLPLALGRAAKPLDPATREDVRAALAAVLNRVELAYRKAETQYDFAVGGSSAEALLYVIRDGLEADEARYQRLKEGRPLDGDLGPPRAL